MKLFHGTTRNRAKKILENGFKRAKTPSFTGTGVNLTKAITIGYEYGTYEYGGCVLEVELKDDANILVLNEGCPNDEYFHNDPELDAIKSYHGNVYVIWNVDYIKAIRIIPKKEAVKLLHEAFEEDGQNCGYNGEVQDHCDKYWNSILEKA